MMRIIPTTLARIDMNIKQKREAQFELEDEIMEIFYDFSDESVGAMANKLSMMAGLEEMKLPYAFSETDAAEIQARADRYRNSSAIMAEFAEY